MAGIFGYQFYACGRNGLPRQIVHAGTEYKLAGIFKHDFFAATAVYQADRRECAAEDAFPAKIVLKQSRQHNFFGLPMHWLGELICDHEVSILRRLEHVPGTPRFLGRYGRTALLYEYIEGENLKHAHKIPDHFFDRLGELLRHIHSKNIVYLDLNKQTNILVGPDGEPHLIDFQIALHIHPRSLIWPAVSNRLLSTLQQADIYHLLKHKRKLCPQQLSCEEFEKSRARTILINLHRAVATPLRKLRRWALRSLEANGLIPTEGQVEQQVE